MIKNHVLVMGFAILASGAFAQSTTLNIKNLAEKKVDLTTSTVAKKSSIKSNKDLQVEIWSDDFSSDTSWTLGHDEDLCTLEWQIGVGLEMEGTYTDGPINSTTASNGYAMLDSFYYNEQTNNEDTESSWMTNAESIDLTDSEFITLEFESYFRTWNLTTCFVVISTNNTDWPSLTYDFDPSTNPNVFSLYDYLNTNQATANPEVTSIDISEIAGGESEVWIRFHWTAETTIYGSGYGWFVDDVTVNELQDNDLDLNYGVISHNGTGNEYGKVPASQLNENMTYSALVTNIGAQTQTNVIIEVEVFDENNDEIVNVSTSLDSLQRLEEYYYVTEQSQELFSGLYTVDFSVTSTEEMDGDYFDNNFKERKFMVTDDVYSLDAIGVDDESTLASIGTNSFSGAEDGFMILMYYDLSNDENALYGAEIALANGTIEGGTVFIHLLDTADVLSANAIVDDPLYSSDEYIITSDDVDAGIIRIYFDEEVLLDEDAYYLAFEMYSENNDFTIIVLDDLTTPQPGNSSMIYIPTTNTVYGNGNAAAVRLLTMAPNSVNEIEKIAVLSQNHPNPANEYTTISFELLDNQEVTVRLTDMLGKVVAEKDLGNLNPGVHNHTFDLNGLKAGTYHYSIVTENGSLSKSMQVIK